jgi:hypothetical protein
MGDLGGEHDTGTTKAGFRRLRLDLVGGAGFEPATLAV